MLMNLLLERFKSNLDCDAICFNQVVYKYDWLYGAVTEWYQKMQTHLVQEGSIVAIHADYTPKAIAILIALAQLKCIVVPLTNKSQSAKEEYLKISQTEYLVEINGVDEVSIKKLESSVDNKLLLKLRENKKTGLVLFSSGSTGKSKAAIHDFELLFEKHVKSKRKTRVVAFLLFDHIGGLNTLFYTLFNSGCLIISKDRTPQQVCNAISTFKAEALTTTPTFLNLLLLSGASASSLESLRFVNYGTEVMQEWLLEKLNNLLPSARFSQAYGLSEVGVLPAKSKSSESLFIKIDGEGFETRIVDGMLEIRANSSMLGYINEPDPFTADGWFKTGDAVEVDGEYIRVLGRKSDLINVGGVKVYPAEVENVIQQVDGVEQVSVFAERNAITGQIVVAKVKLKSEETLSYFRNRLRKFCESKLANYKIPQKIILTNSSLHNDRFKTMRN